MTKPQPSAVLKLSSLLAAALLTALVFMESPARYARAAQSQPGQENGYSIKSSVELVVLHITVHGRNGKPVPGLTKEDFRIYEDGVPQEIESFSHDDLPVTMGLVIDNSGSMVTKRRDVNQAALALVRASNPQDQVFVINFNETVSFGLSHDVPFTSDPHLLSAALSRTNPEGKTALYDAVSTALDHLNMGGPDKKAVVLVSDGGDNASAFSLDTILDQATRSNAIIYTVGIFDPDDPDRNPRVLEHLAKASGGQAFFPESITDINTVCQSIAFDLRNQYTLTYKPSNNKQDGTFRSVRIRVNAAGHGHLSVRARPGYYAPLNSALASVGGNADDRSD